MRYEESALTAIITSVRKRRTLLTTLRGAAIVLAVTAAMLLVTGLSAYRYRFSVGALVSLRIFALLSVITAIVLAVVRPLRKRISDGQIARLVEEKHSGLDDRLVSAVEFSDLEQQRLSSTAIIDRLMEDADRSAGQVAISDVVPNQRFWQFGGAAAVSVLFFIGVLVFGPREIPKGLAQLFGPPTQAAEKSALQIELKPGTARV